MKRFTLLFALFALTVGSFAQSTQRRGDFVFSGQGEYYKVQTSSNDTTFITAGADTFYTDWFQLWGLMSTWFILVDTAISGDSVYVNVDLLVSDRPDSAQFIWDRTLEFKRPNVKTASANVNAQGKWAANLTDEPILIGLYGRYRIRAGAGHLGGYALIRNTSKNPGR